MYTDHYIQIINIIIYAHMSVNMTVMKSVL